MTKCQSWSLAEMCELVLGQGNVRREIDNETALKTWATTRELREALRSRHVLYCGDSPEDSDASLDKGSNELSGQLLGEDFNRNQG